MADLLAGQTQHSLLAPLSHGQTLAISKHLQEQIVKLEARFANLRQDVDHTNESLSSVRQSVGHTNTAVHALQDGLAGTNHALDSTRKDLGRTNGSLQKLQAGFQRSSENLAALSEGQKINTTSIEQVNQEVTATHQLANKIQDVIERTITVDIAALRDELGRTDLEVKQLRIDEDKTKAIVLEERENLRETNAMQKAVRDDINKTNTVVNILEHRLADTTSSLKTAKQNVEDLNEVTVKLHESHEKTRSQVTDVQAVCKKVVTQCKDNRETIEALQSAQATAMGRLQSALDALDTIRQEKDEQVRQIQSLKQGQDMAAAHVQTLRGELADNCATTKAVKDGLKETSSLLLPNIHLDSSEARQASMRHGGLLHTSALAQTNGSPRKGGSGNSKSASGPFRASGGAQNAAAAWT